MYVTAALFEGDQSVSLTFQVNATNRRYNQAALIFHTKGKLWNPFSGAALERPFVCSDVQVKMGLERKARIEQNRFYSVQIPKILNWSKQWWAMLSSVFFSDLPMNRFCPLAFFTVDLVEPARIPVTRNDVPEATEYRVHNFLDTVGRWRLLQWRKGHRRERVFFIRCDCESEFFMRRDCGKTLPHCWHRHHTGRF